MAKYNVSKREAKELGIERVRIGGDKKSGSKSGSDSQLKALQGSFTSSLKPTKEEEDTDTQLGNIITSKELGIQKAEQTPIAQKFITGQSAGLEKSAALKALPLQTRLANLQARRQSASDVLKAQLGFATSAAETATQKSQFGQTFGEGQRQFDVTSSLAQQQEDRLREGDKESDNDDKEINDAYAEADKLRKELQDKKIDWGYAWGRMKDRFPNASTEFIDKALGVDLRGY